MLLFLLPLLFISVSSHRQDCQAYTKCIEANGVKSNLTTLSEVRALDTQKILYQLVTIKYCHRGTPCYLSEIQKSALMNLFFVKEERQRIELDEGLQSCLKHNEKEGQSCDFNARRLYREGSHEYYVYFHECAMKMIRKSEFCSPEIVDKIEKLLLTAEEQENAYRKAHEEVFRVFSANGRIRPEQ